MKAQKENKSRKLAGFKRKYTELECQINNQIAKTIYEDLRDVNKFVKSILKSRTYVKRDGKPLNAVFPPQQSKKSARALEKLCTTFNKYGNLNSVICFKKMIFGVREKH